VMGYRPADVAHFRADLKQWYASQWSRAVWQRYYETGAEFTSFVGHKFTPESMEDLRRLEEQGIRLADLYYVSADMLALAKQAADSSPSYVLRPDDLPSGSGVMLFDGELEDPGQRKGAGPRSLVAWHPIQARSGLLDLYLSAYCDISGNERINLPPYGRFQYDTEQVWPLDPDIDAIDRKDLPSDANILQWPSIVRTVWTLMQQPIVTTARAELQRFDRRRLKRAGEDDDPEVRIVQLRRAKVEGRDGTDGDGSREYHHQWLVNGHWRQQWYPSRNTHRPVWVAPYVKGPEGAPMLGGEKVHAWTR
jgi:hypothetical protein